MATSTDAGAWPRLVSELLHRGNSLVPRGRLELHASHCFLFFAACVQRSLLYFFSLPPALDHASAAGHEARGARLRRGAGTEPLRWCAAAAAHAGGGGSTAAIAQPLCSIIWPCCRCCTATAMAWAALGAAAPQWRDDGHLTQPCGAGSAVGRSLTPAPMDNVMEIARWCTDAVKACECRSIRV